MILVQTLVNQLRRMAQILPDFVEPMTALSDQFNETFNEIESIQKSFEKLLQKPISKEKEAELSKLEDQVNGLCVQLLGKKLDFQGHWKPSFKMHRDSEDFAAFAELYEQVLNDTIAIADGLRSSLRSKSEWVRSKKNEKIEQKLRYLTVVLPLTVLAEVLIGFAQIFQTFSVAFAILAFLTPFIIVLAYLLLLLWQTSD